MGDLGAHLHSPNLMAGNLRCFAQVPGAISNVSTCLFPGPGHVTATNKGQGSKADQPLTLPSVPVGSPTSP